MNESPTTPAPAPGTYDRLLGSMDGLPGVSSTKSTTVAVVMPILGTSQTYIIRTFRSQAADMDGKPKPATFTVFLQFIEGERAVKIVLPAKVAEAILRQRESLTKTAMRRRGKEVMQARMDAGFKPNFGGKRGRRSGKK